MQRPGETDTMASWGIAGLIQYCQMVIVSRLNCYILLISRPWRRACLLHAPMGLLLHAPKLARQFYKTKLKFVYLNAFQAVWDFSWSSHARGDSFLSTSAEASPWTLHSISTWGEFRPSIASLQPGVGIWTSECNWLCESLGSVSIMNYDTYMVHLKHLTPFETIAAVNHCKILPTSTPTRGSTRCW